MLFTIGMDMNEEEKMKAAATVALRSYYCYLRATFGGAGADQLFDEFIQTF